MTGTSKKRKDSARFLQDTIERDVNKNHRNNLSIMERKVIREVTNDANLKVYPFDKASGFTIMKKEEVIKRIEEQIWKTNIIGYDPTATLLHNFQKKLDKLRREGKFDRKTYCKIYLSNAKPPRRQKSYPMKTIVSTIKAVTYGTSKYFVEIMQPTLNKESTVSLIHTHSYKKLNHEKYLKTRCKFHMVQ